ncbi:hypothetical protein SARC_00088 [Sphaeroforma arctica JP610]|uniref:Uncharacterized protein n=1 Tax=Sphaeroforma arctica JP610 TaxID=667725 RepID=A0A0L0GG73_9EUKA|nr:hypothetical protein SARC_00088 [Sphaeroforma arctica JP610]KNC87831.1 hypothetical protein SARC_00088 [Sphaeroforma arctica JP610]|eukprot:XP_014161733.1 hypothetical protein SARC_00088 [Sphaeroforma arctica JP610]
MSDQDLATALAQCHLDIVAALGIEPCPPTYESYMLDSAVAEVKLAFDLILVEDNDGLQILADYHAQSAATKYRAIMEEMGVADDTGFVAALGQGVLVALSFVSNKID